MSHKVKQELKPKNYINSWADSELLWNATASGALCGSVLYNSSYGMCMGILLNICNIKDEWEREIPNWLIFCIYAVAIMTFGIVNYWVALGIFLIALLGYRFLDVGGADVKLLPVLAFMGPNVSKTLCVFAIIGFIDAIGRYFIEKEKRMPLGPVIWYTFMVLGVIGG